jgi:hypothetical protein
MATLRQFFFLLNLLLINGISRFSLSQSINYIGIKSFLSSFSSSLSPSLSSHSLNFQEYFQPNQIKKTVTEINLKELEEKGIKGIILDKDNTLTHPYHTEITTEIQEFLKEAKKVKINSLSLSLSLFGCNFFEGI